jgi:nicotinate-nucleotide adenylyltransferase
MSKLGLLGGTFDPPHIGHLILAQAAYDNLNLQKVLFIPASRQPHKQHKLISSKEIRRAMLQLALDGDIRFEVSDIELAKSGLSYTYETLGILKLLYPDDRLVLIIGGDNIADIETWKKPEVIFELAEVAAAIRPDCRQSGKFRDRMTMFKMPQIEISSTQIRELVRNQKPIKYLVPEKVENYIHARRLYL